jgi:hypothetical protein
MGMCQVDDELGQWTATVTRAANAHMKTIYVCPTGVKD